MEDLIPCPRPPPRLWVGGCGRAAFQNRTRSGKCPPTTTGSEATGVTCAGTGRPRDDQRGRRHPHSLRGQEVMGSPLPARAERERWVGGGPGPLSPRSPVPDPLLWSHRAPQLPRHTAHVSTRHYRQGAWRDTGLGPAAGTLRGRPTPTRRVPPAQARGGRPGAASGPTPPCAPSTHLEPE